MAGAWRAAGWLAICLLRPGLGLAGATQHALTKLTDAGGRVTDGADSPVSVGWADRARAMALSLMPGWLRLRL